MRIANTIHQLFVLIATAALFSTTIGCVVVIEPGDDLPWSPPGELCPTHEIACEIGQTPVSLGTNESGCDIYTCAEVACETDDDCEESDMGCRLPEACVPDEDGASDLDCQKRCVLVAQPPEHNPCWNVACEEGFSCEVQEDCTENNAGDESCEPAAACVAVEDPATDEPEILTPDEDEEENDAPREEGNACFGDWDCEDGERCLTEENPGIEEDTNCGNYAEVGVCVPALF